jgi:hypothetical protein
LEVTIDRFIRVVLLLLQLTEAQINIELIGIQLQGWFTLSLFVVPELASGSA